MTNGQEETTDSSSGAEQSLDLSNYKSGGTLYVVTSGSYSDYGVDAIFSTRERAEEYMAMFPQEYGGYNDLGEWELDPPDVQVARDGIRSHLVHMDRDGNVVWHRESEAQRHHAWNPYVINDRNRDKTILVVSLNAKSKEHAVKIANDTRRQMVAQGEWPE